MLNIIIRRRWIAFDIGFGRNLGIYFIINRFLGSSLGVCACFRLLFAGIA